MANPNHGNDFLKELREQLSNLKSEAQANQTVADDDSHSVPKSIAANTNPEPPMFRIEEPVAKSAPITNAHAPQINKQVMQSEQVGHKLDNSLDKLLNERQIVDVIASELQKTTESVDEANERRNRQQAKSRSIGNVISCNGSRVYICANSDAADPNKTMWSIGQMISVVTSKARVVAMVREINADKGEWTDGAINSIIIKADIVGEVLDLEDGQPKFKRGISEYPWVGAIAHKIRTRDLESIFDIGERKGVEIGKLSQNEEISAYISVDDILKRHFAIVGTTGVGKSCAVGLVVNKAMSAEENLRVIMLDPHNEFEGAFGDKSQSLDQSNLEIPYWILNFDELEDVVFRGLINIEESTILRELVLIAKKIRAQQSQDDPLLKGTYNIGSINIDTPVPYRLTDVYKQIDDVLGQLEPRFSRTLLKNIKLRLEMLEANPRYKFMFGFNGNDDSLPRIISNIFRLPANGKPMTTVNLSGLPSEVINCVASVLARLAFDVAQASRGAIKVLLVCEEAHRYVPADRANSFEPTRRAIARIAKEGRKYGCAIAIITQRPGELDPTILSQCSTVFAMRLANENDQAIIKSALADSSASVVSFLAALDNREAIAFGEGVQVPMRLYFSNYDIAKLRNESVGGKINVLKADEVDALNLTKAMRGLSTQEKYEHNNKNNFIPKEAATIDTSQSALLKKPVSEVLKNDLYMKEIANQRQSGLIRKPLYPDRN